MTDETLQALTLAILGSAELRQALGIKPDARLPYHLIADALDLSISEVRRIEREALLKLHAALYRQNLDFQTLLNPNNHHDEK